MSRLLLVTADDFGIGLETSRGILDLAARGVVTSTVLLVNSPHAEASVQLWHRLGRPLELGWHPCLTLDRPILPPGEVPSLVRPDGQFWSLGQLLPRLLLGRVAAREIAAELAAQYQRFHDLVGQPPMNVNGHHHIHIFRPIGAELRDLLSARAPGCYLRRVQERRRTRWWIPGGRVKRQGLTWFGQRAAYEQQLAGFPGADELLGITNPQAVQRPRYLIRWLRQARASTVELTCHPGFVDASLLGRDAEAGDGQFERRPTEWSQLRDEAFAQVAAECGFRFVTAQDMVRHVANNQPDDSLNRLATRAAA